MRFCPKCDKISRVIDSRWGTGDTIRNRWCESCDETWRTIEISKDKYDIIMKRRTNIDAIKKAVSEL